MEIIRTCEKYNFVLQGTTNHAAYQHFCAIEHVKFSIVRLNRARKFLIYVLCCAKINSEKKMNVLGVFIVSRKYSGLEKLF